MAAEEIPVPEEVPVVILEKPPEVKKVPFRREPYKLPSGGGRFFQDIIDRVVGPIHTDGDKSRQEWTRHVEEWEAAGYIEDLPEYYKGQLRMLSYKPDTIGGRIGWYFWMISNTIISIFLFPVGMTLFLLEEAGQAMGMGLWIAYQSKKYDACKDLLSIYIRFVDTSTMIIDKIGWLCPWMSLGVRMYFLAADEQAKVFTKVITEATSTDIGFKTEYFKDIPAKISISSSPTRCKIYIDDRYTRRSTYETMYNVEPHREYHIRVEYTDEEIGLIKSITRTVSALEGEEKHIKFDLRPLIKAREEEIILLPPSLTINSTPDGARIILDGVDTGKKTDHTFEDIAPGEHTIRLEYYVKEKEKTAVVETTIRLEEWERRTERFDLTWEIRAL